MGEIKIALKNFAQIFLCFEFVPKFFPCELKWLFKFFLF